MTVVRARRIGCVLAVVIALAQAGAITVRAADPSPVLGATITANIYVADSRELTIINRSTVEALVTVEPSGGWGVDPDTALVLAPDEAASLTITGDGEDGAPVAVHLRANGDAPEGREAAEIVLGARVYAEAPAPPDAFPPWGVLLAVTALAGLALLAAYLRRREPRIQHARAH